MTEKNAARLDWEQRIGLPSDQPLTGTSDLPAPNGLRSEDGTGHVLLDWQPVEGALGYLVHRADTVDGPYEPLDHRGGDVLAVPSPPYADSLVEPGQGYWYKVASWTDAGAGPLTGRARTRLPEGARIAAGRRRRLGRRLRVTGPAAARMEPDDRRRASFAADPDGAGAGRFRRRQGVRRRAGHRARRDRRAHRPRTRHLPARDASSVRSDGSFDFSGMDEVYDRFLATGLKPVVELSFMPAELAHDPDYTVFEYKAHRLGAAELGALGRAVPRGDGAPA